MVMDRGLGWIGLASLLAALLLWAALDPSFALFGDADAPSADLHDALRGVDSAAEAEDAAGPTLTGRAREATAAPAAAVGEPPPEGTLAGPRFLRVLDDGGRALAGAAVDWAYEPPLRPHEPDPDPARNFGGDPMARTDARGRVAIPTWARTVNGGVYVVRPMGFLRASGRVPRGAAGSALTIRLKRVVKLAGTVRCPAGHVWSGVRIAITHAASGLTFTTTTRADGRWTSEMLPGTVQLEAKAWGTVLAVLDADVRSREPFNWDLKVSGARFVCGRLYAPTAAADARFDIEQQALPGEETDLATINQRLRNATGLRHGHLFRLRVPDGASGSQLVVHRRKPRGPVHTRAYVKAGTTDVVLTLDADDLATGSVRLEVRAPMGWSGVVQLRRGNRNVATRRVTGGEPSTILFDELSVQPEYTVRLSTSPTRRELLLGRVPRGSSQRVWSQDVRVRPGETVDLGVVEVPE